MRYRHESSQGRSSENGMVGGFKVAGTAMNQARAVLSYLMYSFRKFSRIPKVTGRVTVPSGIAALPGTIL